MKPLRAFRKLCRNLYGSYEFTDEYKKNKKLVESSLKDYEKLINDFGADFLIQLLNTPYDIKYKKLKALEIIKEISKIYDVEFCDNNQTMSFKIKLHNKFILETITIKNKEEYDLLKEALLW